LEDFFDTMRFSIGKERQGWSFDLVEGRNWHSAYLAFWIRSDFGELGEGGLEVFDDFGGFAGSTGSGGGRK